MRDINWSFLVQKLLDTLMLSQGELAKLCNVSQQSVSNWKNGKREPEIYAKRKLLDIYQENSLSLYPSSQMQEPITAESNLLRAQESHADYLAQEKDAPLQDYTSSNEDERNEFIEIFEKMPSSKKRELVEITKRKKAEEELKKSEQRYRLLAESSNDIISRMSLENLKFLYVSPACKTLLEYTPEEIEGKTIYDILDPQDKQTVKDFHRQVQGKSQNSIAVSYRIKTKSDKTIWVETSCNTVKMRRNKMAKEIVMVTKGIEKRKDIENALKLSEERFSLLAENSSDVITIHAMDSTLLYASPSCKQLLGYKPSEIIGKNLWDKTHKDDYPELEAKILKSFPWKNSRRSSFRLKRKNGKYVWVETSFKYVKGFINDHTEVLICIFRDITDRKKIEQALEYRETLLIASSSATNCLLSGKTENSIFKALKMICTAARADRIYIFENTNLSASKKPTMSLRYEWNSGNSNSNIDSKDLQNVPYKPNFSRWHRRFNAQKIVKGIVSKFPAVEKTFLENRGVASVLLSPIYSNKKLWGFIGFDDFKQERRWSESEISILTTIGNAFGASIRRIRMEDSLRESEKRFRIIADSAPVMIWLRDSNFKLKYSNKQSCDFTGKKLENSQDDVWKKRIHPDDYQKIWKIVQNAVKTKRKFKLEYRVKRKDGKYRWVLDYGLPRCLFDGEFAGYAGACVDITERKIMEDMLKGSEQKLQMSLDAASTGIWEWDSVNNSLHCDKRISAIFGYPAKELDISMTELSERIHEKDFSILKGKLKKALNTGTLFEQDIRIKAKSGEWKFAHLRGKPNLLEVNKSQEKAAKLLGALHDISEQKSAEMILEETETRYKELFNSMNSGVAVYLPTDDLQDFIIKDMNSAGLKICKISSKNDLLDKKITQEFPSVKEMGLFKVMQKVAKTGRTQRLLGAIYSDQKINACFENVVYKLPDGKIVTVFDDVTEKRLFEEKLAKNERKYRTVLKSANDAIFILDAASKIVLDCNTKAGKILKLGKKEITGFKVFNLHLEEERKIIEGFLHEIEKKGFKNNFECNLMDSKKNALPVEISGNFLKLDGQGLIIEIARDISERKKIESMQKDLDRIAKHDLKSPLNFIINAPEILKNEINGLSQQQLKILQMIEDSAKKMFNTINLSLEMYKIEHGNLKPDLDKVDLCAIIETIEDEQEKLLKDKSANLKVIVNGRPKTKETEFIVKADEFLFYSMLSNLIKNALERTPTGKNVTVRLDKKEKKVFIKINNLGTPPDNIKDRFFEKYSSSGKKGGIGLGTYSAKLVALAHKGKINVASSEKQGTTVSIEIPI